jgi:hypothetical protein
MNNIILLGIIGVFSRFIEYNDRKKQPIDTSLAIYGKFIYSHDRFWIKMKQNKMSVLKPLFGAFVFILFLFTGIGQGFGLVSIDRLNKYEDVFYEYSGIKRNLHPIQMKCIPYDKDASLNDPCKHLEESTSKNVNE